jgi:hypothetical protein
MKPRSSCLFLLVLAACSAGALACGYSGVVSPPPDEHVTIDGDVVPADGGATGFDDGGVFNGELPVVEGGASLAVMPAVDSPLCNASLATGCYPDNPTTAQACPPDGGTLDLSSLAPDAAVACRVATDIDGLSPHPVCAPTGNGTVGQSCTASKDCGPGLDCVATGPMTAACLAYCCKGNSACPTFDFCDVEPLSAQSTAKVPVCVPMRHCELFSTAPGNCPDNETCSVVRVDPETGIGSTSCVQVGTAQAGDSCDKEHCASGLDCIGVPGQRMCFQLCHIAGSDCPPSQVCKGGLPLFSATVGICQ